MEEQNAFLTVSKQILAAKSIIVCLPPDPGKDLITAGLGLHLTFKEAGKISQIGCGSEIHVGENIDSVSEIADTIGSRNLIVSFDYSEENLDKVDYDVRDDGKFYLLIKPKNGAPIPDVDSVKYSYSGAEADLVITLGIHSLEELGKIYADEKNFLDNAHIISLNNSLFPCSFPADALHQATPSLSELATSLLEKTKLEVPVEAANSLLKTIHESSDNFTNPKLSANTFSSIAFLMKQGGRLPTQKIASPKFSQAPFFEIPNQEMAPEEENIPLPEEENLSAQEADAPVPSDWSKPKVFRVKGKQD